ncbi:hypothetical protein IPJ72_00270 [Candidatus Peregrinibacteria bacterium]|nr:MAG: hypothetical protein IPJ72_00270 [Candidatus Peregrinibacteria bacterium]
MEKLSTALTNRFPQINRVMLAFGPVSPFTLFAMDINPERVSLLQQVDEHVHRVMEGKMDDFHIWQFPVVLLPTGVDNQQSVVLRPIASTEAMTAHFARIDWEILEPMVKDILSNHPLSHVFYDLTHKPPGTIEWE